MDINKAEPAAAPTPQEAVCKWCDAEIVPPTNDYPFWSDGAKYLGRLCVENPDDVHEPAAPTPKEKPMEISIDAILPELAKKPLTDSQIDKVARGLLIPSPGLAQRFGIELQREREAKRG